MVATTGPVLAIGAITMANRSILHDEPVDWTVPIATGVAAGMFALIERPFPKAAQALAYTALVAILFTRVGGVESPSESFLTWWNEKK